MHPSSNGSRRDAIIDVAAARFAEQGFHGVSMRDIAREHNSSVAALYNHFDSKDDLLLAVGERFFSVFIRRLEESADAPGDGLTRLQAMLQVSFSVGREYRNELLSISRDSRYIRTTSALAPLIAARDACIAIWDRVIRQGMQDGSVRSGLDTDGVLWIVFSAITGILVPGITEEDIRDPLKCVTEVLTEGLRPRE
jgi:TetR/AcrR family transcriptional regulator, cholesterol catabolism regulator